MKISAYDIVDLTCAFVTASPSEIKLTLNIVQAEIPPFPSNINTRSPNPNFALVCALESRNEPRRLTTENSGKSSVKIETGGKHVRTKQRGSLSIADRIRFIDHEGKRILFVDFSNCNAGEVEQISRRVPDYVTTQPFGP